MAASCRNLILSVIEEFFFNIFTAIGSENDEVSHRPFRTSPKLPIPKVSARLGKNKI